MMIIETEVLLELTCNLISLDTNTLCHILRHTYHNNCIKCCAVFRYIGFCQQCDMESTFAIESPILIRLNLTFNFDFPAFSS